MFFEVFSLVNKQTNKSHANVSPYSVGGGEDTEIDTFKDVATVGRLCTGICQLKMLTTLW